MDRSDLEERVKQILTTRLGMPPEEITAEARLVDDLGMDSLDAVELAIAMERQFKVELSDDQIAKLQTVGDIVTLVQQRMAEAAGA
jgi:acyl carrier protein